MVQMIHYSSLSVIVWCVHRADYQNWFLYDIYTWPKSLHLFLSLIIFNVEYKNVCKTDNLYVFRIIRWKLRSMTARFPKIYIIVFTRKCNYKVYEEVNVFLVSNWIEELSIGFTSGLTIIFIIIIFFFVSVF